MRGIAMQHLWQSVGLVLCWATMALAAWPSKSVCPLTSMRLVNDYWLGTHVQHTGSAGWKNAVYQMGNLAAYEATGETRYREYARRWATENHWTMPAIRVPAVRASTDEGQAPAHAVDQDPTTHWTVSEEGQWLEFELEKRLTVGQMAITWEHGEQSRSVFDIEVSNDRTTWLPVFHGVSSGLSRAPETIDFQDKICPQPPDLCPKYRYVRYVHRGNTAGLPSRLSEVALYNTGNYADQQACGQAYGALFAMAPTPLPAIAAVTASSDDGNGAANVVDNQRGTRWSAHGLGEWISFDLGARKAITHVSIGWFKGHRRRAFFALEVSDDQAHWTRVFRGMSSGTTTAQEVVQFPDVAARFLRYVGYGNSSPDKPRWNSLTEMDIHTAPEDPRLRAIKAGVDVQLYRPAVDDVWWVDALFMVAPLLSQHCALYQDSAYCEKLFALYNDAKTRRALYDPVTGLWYRDAHFLYPAAQTSQGQKILWSRGNGWVMGALVRVLESLPPDDPHRAEYIARLRRMAAALATRQRSDGFWNVSLDDPQEYTGPETSGTTLFTYAMAWGINHGYLASDTYLPVVLKAWDGLVRLAVSSSGKLGYVQGVGNDPSDAQPVTADATEAYGVGAFLLAGKEVAALQNVDFTTPCSTGAAPMP